MPASAMIIPKSSESPAEKRFLLIEDHPLFAEGFVDAIKHLFPRSSVDVFHSLAEGKHALRRQRYDLVFLDRQLPDGDGLDLLAFLNEHGLMQPVTLITGRANDSLIKSARQLGAMGVISKRIDLQRLQYVCDRLLEGGSMFCADADSPVAEHGAGAGDITARELQVLNLLSEGLESKTICHTLGFADSTFRSHLKSLFQKLDVNNRTACVVKALRLGIV